MSSTQKTEKLVKLFKPTDRILIAFSGGVDSTLLLYQLSKISALDVKAVTIKTPYIPQWEVDEAIAFCKENNIDHEVIELPFPKSIITNPGDRCYRCKKILFSSLKDYSIANGYNIIADGSNADDAGEYRPGMKALEELQIRSPLLEAGFTKRDIRNLLREYGLEIWNKPAYACLLTRIPHDNAVDTKTLYIIEEAELYLKDLGFAGTRVRLHKDIARLECQDHQFILINEKETRFKISSRLKQLGIKYVTIDIEGYRTGSMDN